MKKKNITNTMEISTLIKKYNLDWELVGYHKDSTGKKQIHRPTSVKKTQDPNEIIRKFTFLAEKAGAELKVAYIIDIKNSPLAIIDIDENIDIETIHNKMKFTKNTMYLNGNTKGYHIIVECDDFINCKKAIDCLKHFDGDIITDYIMENFEKKIFNKEIINVSKEEILTISKFKFEKNKIKKEINENEINENEINENEIISTFNGNVEELEEIVMNIPLCYSNNYNDWIKIISILKKYHFYDLAKKFSRKSKKYDDNTFDDYYNNCASYSEYDIGTLYFHSKENITMYNRIINKFRKKQIKKKKEEIQEEKEQIKKEKEQIKKEKEEQIKKEKEEIINNLENTYEKVETEFDKTHFKCIKKSIYCSYDNYELVVFNERNFKTSYSNIAYDGIDKNGNPAQITFINDYCKSTTAKVYKDMNIYPNISLCPTDEFNLWLPFKITRDIIDIQNCNEGLEFILHHIKILCNHNEEVYEYVIDWLGHLFQKPWEKSTFLLFVSKEGIGKSTIFSKLLKNMLGKEKVMTSTNPEKNILGEFNEALINSFLIIFEELCFLNTKSCMGTFKSLITDDEIYINPKGGKGFMINSYHRVVGNTNNSVVNIPTTEGDRRKVIIKCSNEKKGNTEYMNLLHKYCDDTNTQHTFYKFLMSRDVDEFISKPLPETEYHKELKEYYESPVLTFLKDYLIQKFKCKGDYIVRPTINELFNDYKDNTENTGELFSYTLRKFNREIQDLSENNIVKQKTNGKMVWNFNLVPLLEEFNINIDELSTEYLMDSDGD